MELGAVPIINENDTVSVEELQTTFGDNDRLAAIVTNLIQAPLLVLLSDVEGLLRRQSLRSGQPADLHRRSARRVRFAAWSATRPGNSARGAWPASSTPPAWPRGRAKT